MMPKCLTLYAAVAAVGLSVASVTALRTDGTIKARGLIASELPTATAPRMLPLSRAVQDGAIGTPLQLNVDQLPSQYPGDSIDAVIARLTAPPKSEFESTAEFNARVAALRPNRTYSFWVDDQSIVKRYDADRQTLKVELPIRTCSRIGYAPNCNAPSILISTIDTGKRTYVGTNSFGVATQVASVSRHYYALFVKPQRTLSIDFEIPMNADQAMEEKEFVHVLISVGPNPRESAPLIYQGSDSSAATLSNPIEIHDTYSYLGLPIVAFWVADSITGHVFKRIDVVP
jgi:hypothetical protein